MNAKKALTNLALLGLIGGVTVMTSGCWEIIVGIALLAKDDPEPTYSDPSYSDPYYSDPYSSDPYDYGDAGVPEYDDPYAVDFTTQSLSGDLGPRAFEGGVYMESGYDYGFSTDLEIHAHSSAQNWRVMTRVQITGGLAHPDLVPGAVLTFGPTNPDYGSSAVYVSLLGCSGAAPDSTGWDFDSYADQVTVEVQEGSTPDTRLLHFVGTWSDGSSVDGSVEYQVR